MEAAINPFAGKSNQRAFGAALPALLVFPACYALPAEPLHRAASPENSFASLPRICLTTASQYKFRQKRLAVERLLDKIGGGWDPATGLLEPNPLIRSACVRKQK